MKKKQQIQTNGRIENAEITTLEAVWGNNDLAKYGTLNEDKYREEINAMNRSDLDDHARRVGITIPEKIDHLKTNLLRQFRVYVASLQQPPAPTSTKPFEMSKDIERILAEGK